MSRRLRNLLLAGGIAIAAGLFAAAFLFPSAEPSESAQVSAPLPAPDPEQSPRAPIHRAESETRVYAVSLPRLQGLPATAVAGTRLELWVAWEPPITKAPRFQKLLDDVVLEEIVPPPVPEAPPTALLSVDVDHVADLLYADRFGALTATIVPDQ
jgi:hypothetical protein